MSDGIYIGRFAPSPTGPLHFGSLIAALGSYLQARSKNGKWLVRIEDIDPPREVPGSADQILHTLEAFELYWDDTVLYQSSRLDHYRVAVEHLLAQGQAFRCRCTRRTLARESGKAYPGLCRSAQVPITENHSVRVLTDQQIIQFDDLLQGHAKHNLQSEGGDYIVKRRDGLYAYQLAVTLDDDFQGVTEIVRGYDLLNSTARQIHLLGLLNLSQPGYMHLPLALGETGQKLSKQTGAAGLPEQNRRRALFDALCALCQTPPSELQNRPLSEQLGWAVKNWNINTLQGISAVELDKERALLRTVTGALGTQHFSRQ